VTQSWQAALDRWLDAGLLDVPTIQRIQAFEASNEKPGQLRWPVLIAVGFGALMLGAGVLLFVAAHWDHLSPTNRFSLVLAMVAVFHVAGALAASRFVDLATALHGIGTVAAGAGIFLSAQIFNLEEHWPGGIMLWAVAAWIGWFLLRDWVQVALAAILTPAWLASEWIDFAQRHRANERWAFQGLLLLALTYLSAIYFSERGSVRKALAWIGGIALLPLSAICAINDGWMWAHGDVPTTAYLIAVPVGILIPLVFAYLLRGRESWKNLVAAIWVLAASLIPQHDGLFGQLAPFLWCGIGAIGLIAWGLEEARKERINLGIAGFGLTVLVFYFSRVMDKLGRSASLISLGLLFLLMGWLLEKTRRRLIAQVPYERTPERPRIGCTAGAAGL
jgi:uncharacterized membrane protein